MQFDFTKIILKLNGAIEYPRINYNVCNLDLGFENSYSGIQYGTSSISTEYFFARNLRHGEKYSNPNLCSTPFLADSFLLLYISAFLGTVKQPLRRLIRIVQSQTSKRISLILRKQKGIKDKLKSILTPVKIIPDSLHPTKVAASDGL